MNKNLKIIFVVLIVIALGASAWAIKLSLDMRRLKNPQATALAEVQDIVAEVGKVIALPTNETPTIATVVDPDKIKDQPFFANAQKGDKVLIYTANKKAILWRPGVNQVIEVSALNIPTTKTNVPAIESKQ